MARHSVLPLGSPPDGFSSIAKFMSGPNFAIEENPRSEEHTSELQSPCNLVCRLLLEKKKKKQHTFKPTHFQSYLLMSLIGVHVLSNYYLCTLLASSSHRQLRLSYYSCDVTAAMWISA